MEECECLKIFKYRALPVTPFKVTGSHLGFHCLIDDHSLGYHFQILQAGIPQHELGWDDSTSVSLLFKVTGS